MLGWAGAPARDGGASVTADGEWVVAGLRVPVQHLGAQDSYPDQKADLL